MSEIKEHVKAINRLAQSDAATDAKKLVLDALRLIDSADTMINRAMVIIDESKDESLHKYLALEEHRSSIAQIKERMSEIAIEPIVRG